MNTHTISCSCSCSYSFLHFSPPPNQFNMSNVVELKVNLHCHECIKKILKAIKKMEDIDTYNVEPELNKVIVTGNVTTEEVIRVLHKIGKTATTWNAEEKTN